MANILEKNKVLNLRRRGKSINEISEKLNIPKSTVSVWCRNLKLGRSQIERLAKRQKSGSYKGRMKFLERIRRERLDQTEKLKKEGIKEISCVDKRDLFIAGISMYCSEGATSQNNEEVSFTNSDPKMVLFMLKWFKEICGVEKDRFIIQIRINKIHKQKVKECENYWSDLMKIPLNQFNKTVLIKSKIKKIYLENNEYYGTIRIKVGGATQLRRKINGWAEGLFNGINVKAG